MKAFDKKWKLCTTNERVRQEMAEFDEQMKPLMLK
jgi:hypothetical protein